MRVFVTRELHPFTAGGIGRVIGNILATSSPSQLARTAIVYVNAELDEARFKSVYPEVTFVRACHKDYRVRNDDGVYPALWAYDDSVLHWESVLAMQMLRHLENEHGPIDSIEFPDWGAAAFAATQEKKLGRAFRDTTIAVRLHTTDSVLASVESRNVDIHALALYDLERKALADCDLIVAQLRMVSDAMRDFYGFSPEEWDPRVVVSSPPVLLDTIAPAQSTVEVKPDTPIIFSSKIQHVKRPDVVILGCIEFMRRCADYTGTVRFLAHAFDASYLARLKEFIPEDLEHRFVFLGGVQGAERERAISVSICVFPSVWESFCLAAYEASISGALCVVNENNPAFSPGTPWRDAENCRTFDGTARGLAEVLQDIHEKPLARLRPVTLPGAHEDLENGARSSIASQANAIPARTSSCAIVIACRDSGVGLLSTLKQANEIHAYDMSMHVVDLGSQESITMRVLDEIEQMEQCEVVVHRSSGWDSASSALNEVIAGLNHDYVLLVEPGVEFSPGFVADSIRALDTNQGFDYVVAQHASDPELSLRAVSAQHYFKNVRVLVGEALCRGLYVNGYVAGVLVARRATIAYTKFLEGLSMGLLWDHMMRAVAAGSRVIVSSRIESVNHASFGLLEASSSLLDQRHGYHDLVRRNHIKFGKHLLPMYVMSKSVSLNISNQSTDGRPVAISIGGGQDNDEILQRLIRLENSYVVRYALLMSKTVVRFMPRRLVDFIRYLMRRLL